MKKEKIERKNLMQTETEHWTKTINKHPYELRFCISDVTYEEFFSADDDIKARIKARVFLSGLGKKIHNVRLAMTIHFTF